MTRVFALALFALVLPAVYAADEPLPWSLNQRWECGAGHRNQEWLHSFSPDGKLALFERRSGNLIARDTTSWQVAEKLLVIEPKVKPRYGSVVAYSPDGRLWASSGESEDKRGWHDVSIGHKAENQPLVSVRSMHQQQPRLLFAHDGKTLISASLDALILWDVPGLKAPRKLGPINADPRGYVSSLVLSDDGQTLGVTCIYYGCGDQIWDLKTGQVRVTLGVHTAQVWSVAYAPDGKTIASRGNDPQVKFWDVATGLNIRSIPLETGHHHAPVAFSPDGKQLATSDGPLVRVFDPATCKPTRTLKGHTAGVNALAFSPDGKQMVSGSGLAPQPRIGREAAPGEVIVWDLETAKAQHVLKAHPVGTSVVAWTPDGKLFATAGYGERWGGAVKNAGGDEKKGESDNPIFVWDAATAQRVRTISTGAMESVSALVFSTDSKWLVHDTERDGTSATRVVEVRTGEQVRWWYGAGAAMAFNPDGTMLASVGANWLGLLDPRTGKEVARHMLPDGNLTSVAWSPNGKSLATGGADQLVRLWDVVPGGNE